MLQLLKIKNFALIADQTIEFNSGFNVLVGETGAGKSLVLDALAFVLGEKANKLNIRYGEEKMFVQAVFDLNDKIIAFLKENDIDADENIIISRSLSIDGKGVANINGTIVSASLLKSLSSLIVDTYAQHENVELFKTKNHLLLLDSFAGELISQQKQQISELLNTRKQLIEQMSKLGGNNENRDRELDLLNYQINEIENARLKIGEDEEIKQEIDRLSNYEKIYENLQLININLSVIDEKLAEGLRYLSHAERYDESLAQFRKRIESAKLELKDINDSLTIDSSFDQLELDSLNKRDDEIKLLKKKYGDSINSILEYLENTKEAYDNLLFGEAKLEKLQKQKEEIEDKLYSVCIELSKIRQQVAKKIEKDVLDELSFIGFKNCKFEICFNKLKEQQEAIYTINGIDDVEFLFSANEGEELKSLSKTISGGEMSRFMLALKNVFASKNDTSTLVFDEVDTGISGEIGQKVAERLAKLSKTYQLICITHLCQVTAMADNYLLVKKEVDNNKTFTKIRNLTNAEAIEYIAVVSGAEPTEVALKFATELKDKANQFKSTL